MKNIILKLLKEIEQDSLEETISDFYEIFNDYVSGENYKLYFKPNNGFSGFKWDAYWFANDNNDVLFSAGLFENGDIDVRYNQPLIFDFLMTFMGIDSRNTVLLLMQKWIFDFFKDKIENLNNFSGVEYDMSEAFKKKKQQDEFQEVDFELPSLTN